MTQDLEIPGHFDVVDFSGDGLDALVDEELLEKGEFAEVLSDVGVPVLEGLVKQNVAVSADGLAVESLEGEMGIDEELEISPKLTHILFQNHFP